MPRKQERAIATKNGEAIVNLKIPRSMLEEVDRIRKDRHEDRNRSQMLRRLLDEALQRRRELKANGAQS